MADRKVLVPIILLVLAISIKNTVNCQYTPTITEDIRKVVRQTGETGVLLCKVKIPRLGEDGLVVDWSKPSEYGDVRISRNARLYNALHKYAINLNTIGDITEYRLTVRNLQVNDGGEYRCQVSWSGNVGGVFKVGLLEVQIPPEILANSTNSLMVNQYETVVIKCIVKGMPEPRITWTKGSNNQLPTNHRIEKNVTDGLVTSMLTLYNVTTADQGLYRCAANNDFRRDEHTMQLSVSYACEAWYPIENFQAVFNGDGLVECYGKGVPDPTVKWYYWGTDRNSVPTELWKWASQTQLTEGAKYNLIVAHNQSIMHKNQLVKAELFKLMILTVDDNDIGYYGCLAENSLGKSAAIVRLYLVNATTVYPTSESTSTVQSTATAAPLATRKPICGGTFTDVEGFIKSPNYPSNYNNNDYRKWSIIARPGQRIQMTILNMAIEMSAGCATDYLLIENAMTLTPPPTLKLCGDNAVARSVSSMAHETSLILKTDGRRSYQGFLLYYQVLGCAKDGLPTIENAKHVTTHYFYKFGYVARFDCDQGFKAGNASSIEFTCSRDRKWVARDSNIRCQK